MRSSIRFALLALATLSRPWSVDAQTATSAPDAAGRWEGTISMPDGEVGITIHLAKDVRGAWIGSITIPGTTAADVPLDSFAMNGSSVKFHAGLLESPTFSGALAADGASIAGDVANARGAVPFSIRRAGDASVNVPPPSSSFAEAKDVAGTWEGSVEAGNRTIRMSLKITAGPNGAAVASLVNTDLGITVPITTVTYKEKELKIESRAITGGFAGKLGVDGAITGQWRQSSQKLPLTFRKATAS